MSLSGCRWQEKSFSVAVSESKPQGKCDDCGGFITGVIYHYNGSTICKDCFSKRPSVRQGFDEGFYTTKDRLYDFIDYKNFKKPTEVRGKGHWKKLLKQHGLTDDFDQTPKTEEKLRQDGQFHKRYEPAPRKFIAEQILGELQQKGLYNKLIKRRR